MADKTIAERLIERGRSAMAAHYANRPVLERPIGIRDVNVVLRDDFERYVTSCAQHVIDTHRPIYVLDQFGKFCLVLCTTDR